MTYDKVISFGKTCAPAAHIRQALGDERAYFFDWLITHPPALRKTLDNDFSGLLLEQNLTLNYEKNRVIDVATGLEYQHDFPSQDGEIVENFKDMAGKVREKYDALACRTKDLLTSGSSILLVRYGATDPLEVNEEGRGSLIELLRQKFPSLTPNVLWVTMLPIQAQKVDFGWIHPVPYTNDWKGDHVHWRDALQFAGVSTKT